MQILSGALTVRERAIAAEKSKEICWEGIGKAKCWLLGGREHRGDKGNKLIFGLARGFQSHEKGEMTVLFQGKGNVVVEQILGKRR